MSGGFVGGDAPVAAFVFGKMPAHGDFVSRGLDDETIEAGDAAVAAAVDLAALRWDFEWDDIYVETPVWRFLASPGALGRDWLAGVFMASVDAVGRQFPMLAGFCAPTLAMLARPDATSAALDEAEAIARAALIDALPVDEVQRRLADAAERAFGDAAAAAGDPVAVFAGRMLRHLESPPWAAQSLWWVAGGGEDQTLRLEGALTGEGLSPLFRRAPAPDDGGSDAGAPATLVPGDGGGDADTLCGDADLPEGSAADSGSGE
ncbi:MAG: type VI secretion system-associated protein TagF [Alphaproteobacteria bacterium]|nr:type VI secretion system-associated protein TagF [Alphaproteobacteria bacterium]